MNDGSSPRQPKQSVARLRFVGPYGLVLLTLGLVSLIHLVSLWIFAKGFLLNRVALSNRADAQSLPPRYRRLIFLVVDALRDDFLFPLDPDASDFVPFFHNVLTTPARLSREQPTRALSFRFVADPPTTTLQRLKGLTVGTLPTFIDAGSNFVGSQAEEDSWLEQASRAGKKIAFMGDDTWLTVFPPASGVFDANLTFPYDSFNVEDLDTVDDGVRKHLYSLLNEQSWSILIGHFLGLDHVGHRLGPYHTEMTRKLRETDEVVQRVIAKMRTDDLFVLIGDHGMDSKGDHGGDSALEVNAALWLYSPSGVTHKSMPKGFQELLQQTPESFFQRNGKPERSVPQISLVPTLSLLLGLPIPFSNLGSVIPELFGQSSSLLEKALKINADQLAGFLRVYTAQGAGADLISAATGLLAHHAAAQTNAERSAFLSRALQQSRDVWATFDFRGLLAGLMLLLGGLVATARLYGLSVTDGALWRNGMLRKAVYMGLVVGGEGAFLAGVFGLLLRVDYSWIRLVAGGFTGSASMGIIMAQPDDPVSFHWRSLPGLAPLLLPLVHASIFASNSLVVFEDRVVLALLVTPLACMAVFALSSRVARLRWRIFGFSSAAIICLRIASHSRLCREEQQGSACTTNFYGHDQLWLLGSLMCSLVLPTAVKAFMAISKAHHGFTAFYLDAAMRIVLLCGTGYWYFEGRDADPAIKNSLAWTAYVVSIGSAFLLWRLLPLTHGLGQTEDKRIAIFGFANLFGASYLNYFCLLFSLLYALSQPAGQVGMAFGLVGLLCALEANDSRRDALELSVSEGPSLVEIAFLSLWAHVMYFATGHQATLPSIPWKVAFAGTTTVQYPLSPVLVVLNSFGPLSILPALATPLLVFWNVSPPPPRSAEPTRPMYRRLLRACLGLSLLFTVLALPATIFAAHFRRHLMVWKVFAPRWMLAATALIGVDLTLLVLSVFLGASVTLKHVARFVGAAWA